MATALRRRQRLAFADGAGALAERLDPLAGQATTTKVVIENAATCASLAASVFAAQTGAALYVFPSPPAAELALGWTACRKLLGRPKATRLTRRLLKWQA